LRQRDQLPLESFLQTVDEQRKVCYRSVTHNYFID